MTEHVAGHYVGLDLVAGHLFIPAMMDRVQNLKELGGAALAEPGDRLHDPGRRVSVLAAVLADSGQVALDVAGVEGSVVEGRRQQKNQLIVEPNQPLLDRPHGPAASLGYGGGGKSTHD